MPRSQKPAESYCSDTGMPIRQRGGFRGHQQDDQIEFLHNGNEDQHEARMKPPLESGNTMRIKRLKKPCACNLSCFLQLAADLQHIGGAGAGSERQMLDDRGNGQQCERAYRDGTSVTPNSCCGAENIDRKMPPNAMDGIRYGMNTSCSTTLPCSLPRPLAQI